jgi:hypothetical protein
MTLNYCKDASKTLSRPPTVTNGFNMSHNIYDGKYQSNIGIASDVRLGTDPSYYWLTARSKVHNATVAEVNVHNIKPDTSRVVSGTK